MINRFPGLTPTRSRAVVHDDLIFTVAVAPDPVTPSLYEQTVKALGRIDEARVWLTRRLELQPGLTIAEWKARTATRFASLEILALYEDGLRKAGLPEE